MGSEEEGMRRRGRGFRSCRCGKRWAGGAYTGGQRVIMRRVTSQGDGELGVASVLCSAPHKLVTEAEGSRATLSWVRGAHTVSAGRIPCCIRFVAVMLYVACCSCLPMSLEPGQRNHLVWIIRLGAPSTVGCMAACCASIIQFLGMSCTVSYTGTVRWYWYPGVPVPPLPVPTAN